MMALSQIQIFGLLIGGGILLAFLLIYTSLLSLHHWRKWALPTGSTPDDKFTPLVSRFSDSPQVTTLEPAGLEPDLEPQKEHSRGLVSTWEWIGILLVAVMTAVWAELNLIELMTTDVNSDIRSALLAFVIAGVLFVLVSSRVDPPSVPMPFKAVLPVKFAPPAILWLTNLFLSFIILDSVGRGLPSWATYVLLGAWIINILLFCWNVFQAAGAPTLSRDAVMEWWRVHRLEVLLVVLIGVVSLLLRTVDLSMYPYAFINDEGEVGREALGLIFGERSTFFFTGWAGQPLVSFLPTAFFIKLLGNTALAVRLFSALQGTLAVIFLYLLAREAFGRPTAFLAACLLMALPWHVHFSRLGVMNISDSFFSAGALWLTYRALRRGHYMDYLPAGLMTGFALYSYVGSRLVILMVIGVLAYAALRQRDYLRTHFRHLTILVLAFLVVASPIMLSFSYYPDDFMGRINTENLLANHLLEQYASDAGMSISDFMVRQFQDSTMIFIAMPGPGQFFDTPRPYLMWWSAVFLILGMAYATWRFKEVRYIMLLCWFWAPIIIGSALTQLPPSHQRMLSAAPVTALLVALGLWKLAQSIQQIARLPVRWVMMACVLIVGFTAWQDAHFYFVGEFRTDHHFELAGDEFSYEVGKRAAALGPNYQLLIIGEPEIFAEFADFHYLAPASNPANFNTVTPETIASLPRDRGIFFAAIPSRVDELQLVADSLPGGEWIEVPRLTQEGVSYYGYILPAP